MFSLLVILFSAAFTQEFLAKNSTAAEQQSSRCIVYTFFEDLTGGIKFESNRKVHMQRQDHLLVMQCWLRNWYANGWLPQILRLSDAKEHPNYKFYHKKFANFPTVNWRAYEMTCYLRWLAFAQKGGGVFVDYDIMNFPVTQIPKACGVCGKETNNGDFLASYPKFWPMLVFGGQKAAERMISVLAEYEVDPERDVYEDKAHISDMIIVKNYAEHLFDMALPNPRNILHFASIAKATLASKVQEDMQEQHQNETENLLASMSRVEWIRRTMTIACIQRNRIYAWTLDGKNLDSFLHSLLTPLMNCPEVGTPEFKILHEDAKMARGEYPICDFRITNRLTEKEQANERVILFLEPIEEMVLRPLLETASSRKESKESLEAGYKLESSHNPLVRRFVSALIADKDLIKTADLSILVEHLKDAIAGRADLIFGFMDRPLDSKMVLEYSLGFTLPSLAEPYVPPTRRHAVNLGEEQRNEILRLNWADLEIYNFIRSRWERRLEEVKVIEQQLSRYHDGPVSFYEEFV